MDSEEPIPGNSSSQFDLADYKCRAGKEREHGPVPFPASHQTPEPLGDVEKEEWAKMPDVLLFRHGLADKSSEQTNESGHRARQPFVISECGETDQRAAEKADDPAADQAHEEGALEGQIKETVAYQAKHHAQGQRGRQEEEQHHFLVGVAIFREDQVAKRAKADEESGKRGSPAHL